MNLARSPGWTDSPTEAARPGGKAGDVGLTSPAPGAVSGIDSFILWIRQET